MQENQAGKACIVVSVNETVALGVLADVGFVDATYRIFLVLFAGVSGHVPQGLTGEGPDDHTSVAFQEYVERLHRW